MKKFIRLALIFLVPGLLLVFITVVLAGPAGLEEQSSNLADQVEQTILAKPTETNWGGPAAQQFAAFPGSMTYTVIYVKLPAFFTTTLEAAGSSLFEAYTWYFGDGSPPVLSGTIVSHVYENTGTYTITVLGLNAAEEVISDTKVVVVKPAPYQVYLPIILSNSQLPQPDLVCTDLQVTPPSPSKNDTLLIAVEIESIGGPADGFWVDLYIDPDEEPAINKRWDDICTLPCLGIAWPISNTVIPANEKRVLVSVPNTYHPNGYAPKDSNWTGRLSARPHTLYAFVDSVNPGNDEGAVAETNESNNRCGPVPLTVTENVQFKIDISRQGRLPDRSKP